MTAHCGSRWWSRSRGLIASWSLAVLVMVTTGEPCRASPLSVLASPRPAPDGFPHPQRHRAINTKLILGKSVSINSRGNLYAVE